MTELVVSLPEFRGDTKILFSYKTPVAALNLSPEWHDRFGNGMIRTSKKWSATTTRHINKYLGGNYGAQVDQDILDMLATPA